MKSHKYAVTIVSLDSKFESVTTRVLAYDAVEARRHAVSKCFKKCNWSPPEDDPLSDTGDLFFSSPVKIGADEPVHTARVRVDVTLGWTPTYTVSSAIGGDSRQFFWTGKLSVQAIKYIKRLGPDMLEFGGPAAKDAREAWQAYRKRGLVRT